MSFHQDLDAMTRDMHSKSLRVEYMQKTPVLNLILERKDVEFKGGKRYYFEADTDTVEDLAQDYVAGDVLTHGTKDTIKTPMFYRKGFQLPITLDLDEELENALDTEDRTKLHDLAKHKVKKANEGCRLHLRKLIYGAATDTDNQVQGLNSALTVDATYGTLTRTAASSVNDWWQPADNRYTTSTQASERSCNFGAIQGWVDPLIDLENGKGNFAIIVGNTLFLKLRQEAQARGITLVDDPTGKMKYGIEEMVIDGYRIVKDPFLQSKYNTSMGLTTGSAGALERRFYALNLADWHLKAHPKRFFQMNPFFDQSQIAGGVDFRLARVYFWGNLLCEHPNRSLYFSNVV